MFTDAFGQENLLSDKRHSAGARPPYCEVARKFLVLWKSNKKDTECQRQTPLQHEFNADLQRGTQSFATCWISFPRGLQIARSFPRSVALNSGPASASVCALRLSWITPITFPSARMGALIIR